MTPEKLQEIADLFGEMGWRLRTKIRIAEAQSHLGKFSDVEATLAAMHNDLSLMEPIIQRWVDAHHVVKSSPRGTQ